MPLIVVVGHVDGAQVSEHSLPNSTYQTFNLDYSGVEYSRSSFL